MPDTTVRRIVVVGSASRLGERVVARLRDAGVEPVGIDRRARPGVVDVVGDVDDLDLKPRLHGAACVVHLAGPLALGAVLDAAADASVGHVVVASSATVYGAWPDNPVPLTEDVPLRPNPGFVFAARAAEGERRAAEWRDGHPDATVAVLRFVPVLLPGGETWLSETLARPSLLRPADLLPPVQVLHVEDAAAAVAHAAMAGLDGTFNVAPETSVPGDTARALSAAGIPLPLPERAAAIAERWAWRLRVGGVPRPAEPYRQHPWVVASDRLRATGWSPSYSAEEALVACRKGSRWRELSPKRRQEAALGVVGALGLVVVAAVAVAVRGKVRASRRA
ncbi:MAG TPA: NAD-dependent epimerase/dehydratase family protein [Acidimicrobiales bacterium]